MILTPFLMDLAKVLGRMREDWPLPSIHRALCQCEGRSEAEVALAAVRVAADPESKSPTRLTLSGPWWLPVDNTDRKPHLVEARLPPRFEREPHRPCDEERARRLASEARERIRAARPRTEEPTDG